MSASPALIHVVDDDASFLTAICRFLRAHGYEVRRYRSAAEFLEKREVGVPGCVLADLRMPGRSGLDLQAELTDSDHPLPVVFLSGHGDVPTTVRAMKGGAEDFLTKQAPKEELLAAIDRALERDARELPDVGDEKLTRKAALFSASAPRFQQHRDAAGRHLAALRDIKGMVSEDNDIRDKICAQTGKALAELDGDWKKLAAEFEPAVKSAREMPQKEA